MSFDLMCSASAADDLLLARRRLAEASDRLRAMMAVAVGLADRTDWQTPTARRFRAEVDEWRESLGAVWRQTDAVDMTALQLRLAVAGPVTVC
jgi:hypothetical protein